MDNFKELLEIVYFISGPILVFIAYLALEQIKVAKSQIEEQRDTSMMNAKRDSLKLTSEQVSNYGTIIIPLQNVLDQAIKKNDIKYFSESSVDISEGDVKVTHCQRDGEFEKMTTIMSEFTEVMNAMEGFAVYFTSGVADENVAYLSLSNSYCNQIRKLLPLLTTFGAVEGAAVENRRFIACIRLFSIWNSRLEAEKLEEKKLELDKKIKSHKTYTIPTVGTT